MAAGENKSAALAAAARQWLAWQLKARHQPKTENKLNNEAASARNNGQKRKRQCGEAQAAPGVVNGESSSRRILWHAAG
jgi:hypothetical protein